MNQPVLPKADAHIFDRLRSWRLVIGVAVISTLLQAGGAGVRYWARYEPARLESLELWRLLTAHLVHLGWGHLWLNLAALVLIQLLFEDVLGPLEWVGTAIVSAFAIDAGLYFFDPEVQWYVGLSGVLHGLVACGAWELLRRRSSIGALLAIGLSAKLIWEQWWGPVPLTASSVGGPVIVAAHLYGTVGGTLVALSFALARRRPIA